jgi:hypothetical protein
MAIHSIVECLLMGKMGKMTTMGNRTKLGKMTTMINRTTMGKMTKMCSLWENDPIGQNIPMCKMPQWAK